MRQHLVAKLLLVEETEDPDRGLEPESDLASGLRKAACISSHVFLYFMSRRMDAWVTALHCAKSFNDFNGTGYSWSVWIWLVHELGNRGKWYKLRCTHAEAARCTDVVNMYDKCTCYNARMMIINPSNTPQPSPMKIIKQMIKLSTYTSFITSSYLFSPSPWIGPFQLSVLPQHLCHLHVQKSQWYTINIDIRMCMLRKLRSWRVIFITQ